MLWSLPPARLCPRSPDFLAILELASLLFGPDITETCVPTPCSVRGYVSSLVALKRSPCCCKLLLSSLGEFLLFLIRIICELVAKLGVLPGFCETQDSHSPWGT